MSLYQVLRCTGKKSLRTFAVRSGPVGSGRVRSVCLGPVTLYICGFVFVQGAVFGATVRTKHADRDRDAVREQADREGGDALISGDKF